MNIVYNNYDKTVCNLVYRSQTAGSPCYQTSEQRNGTGPSFKVLFRTLKMEWFSTFLNCKLQL